jgi:hypothetical protein
VKPKEDIVRDDSRTEEQNGKLCGKIEDVRVVIKRILRQR